VPNLYDFLTHSGSLPGVVALIFVALYFVIMALAIRILEPRTVLVAQYNPPTGVSPAVAAWLLERGALPRALAAAIVNMAAKRYLRIEQSGDLYSIVQLGPDVSLDLEPEEDALACNLFKGYDCFDFVDPTPQLQGALKDFSTALMNTNYLAQRILFSIPAWALSGLGIAFALVQGNFLPHANRAALTLLTLGFASFIVAVRTLPGTLQKIATRSSATTAPQRPWSGADSMNFTLLIASLGAIALLATLSTSGTALVVAAFLAVNAFFFHALQGPTAAGSEVIAQLAEYKEFLAKVDADAISRMNSCETPPSEMTQKHAYAIAFHLDLGWGQQFVDAIADLVERSEIFSRILRGERELLN
jgi:hypothetical protein